MAELLVINNNQREIIVLREENSIGREVGNSIQILDARISRFHAKIFFEDGHYELQDMSSRNRTAVNDVFLEHAVLQDGDVITIGDTTMTYYEGTMPRRTTSDSRTQIIETPFNIRARLTQEAAEGKNATRAKEPENAAHRLDAFYRASALIENVQDLNQLLQKLLDLLFDTFKPERGFIILLDPMNPVDQLVPYAVRLSEDAPNVELPISRTIIDEVIRTKVSILSDDAMADKRFKRGESVVFHGIRSAICAPILYQDETLGVIHLDSDEKNKVFAEEDLPLMTGIARQAALAIKNAIFFKEATRYRQNLEALQEAIQEVSTYLDRESIFENTVKYACALLGCQRASFVARGHDKDAYRIVYAVGMPRDLWHNLRITPSNTVLDKVINDNCSLRYDGLTPQPEIAKLLKKSAGKYKTKSFLVAPVPMRGQKLGRGLEEKPMGALCLTERNDGRPFTDDDQKLLTILAAQAGISATNAHLYERATVDDLTGLYVRRIFLLTLEDEIAACRRNNLPLCLLMLDLDYFKIFNDTYGHPAGDYVLQCVGQIVRKQIRREDIPARYGGEEFAIIAPGTDLLAAEKLAERIRAAIEKFPFKYEDANLAVTISIGVAFLEKNEDSHALIKRSDEALYLSKQNGRNRISIWEKSREKPTGNNK